MSCFYLHDLTLALHLVTTDFFFSQQREKKISTSWGPTGWTVALQKQMSNNRVLINWKKYSSGAPNA